MNFISILKAKLDIKNGERRDFRKFVLVILIEDCVQKMIKRRVRGFSCEPSHSPLFRWFLQWPLALSKSKIKYKVRFIYNIDL